MCKLWIEKLKKFPRKTPLSRHENEGKEQKKYILSIVIQMVCVPETHRRKKEVFCSIPLKSLRAEFMLALETFSFLFAPKGNPLLSRSDIHSWKMSSSCHVEHFI